MYISENIRHEIFPTTDPGVWMKFKNNIGLGAYLHTSDISRAHRVAGKLEAGMVIINGLPGMSPGAPFGGYKQSGFGREGGRWGIEEFLQQKNVFIAGTS